MKKFRITSIPQNKNLDTYAEGGVPRPGLYTLDGYTYKQDMVGKWYYQSGQPVDDSYLITKLDQQAKPAGTSAITQAPINTKILTSKPPAEKKLSKDSYIKELEANIKKGNESKKPVPSLTRQAPTQPIPNQAANNFSSAVEIEQQNQKKKVLQTQEALARNYNSVAMRTAQDIQSKNPKLSFEQSLEQAKTSPTLLNETAYNLFVNQDPVQSGYSLMSKEDNVSSLDLNDPNHVEMDGRMPQTAGEYLQRGADILFNPLDTWHYAMSPTEEMPINMYEYEKAKQQTGYEDGADRNAVNSGLDFASWFTGVGTVAQGVKMLRPTGEAIYNFAEDPSWESAGNAALNVGFNAMAMNPLTKFMGGKSAFLNPSTKYAGYAKLPGNTEVMYGNPYLQDAKAIIDLPGFKLAKGNIPKGSVPAVNNPYALNTATTALGLTENAGKSLLSTVSEPHVVTQSPLTTITPALPKKQPLDLDAALAADEANAFTGTSDAYRYDIEKNKNVGEIIDQIKNERVEQLLTREGKARVEALIAENPHMENLTYDDVVNGMRNIINDNAKLTSIENEILATSDELDRVSQAPYLYAEEIQGLTDKLDDLNAEALTLEEKIRMKGSNAYMVNDTRNTASQAIDLRKVDTKFMQDLYRASPDDQFKMFAGLGLSPADLRRVIPHELTHYLQRGKITNLDKELSKLKLRSGNFDIDNNLFADESGVSQFWKRVMDIDRAGGTPFEKIRKYWKTGSKGQEKLAHVDELRADMLERGIMKEFYEEVTPEMIEKHYKQYMSEVGNKYPLRVYELMDADNSNFSLLSGVINRMPAVVGAAATAASYLSDEDSDVSQAGILGALAMFSKKPGKLPIKAINAGKQLLKKGYKSLTTTSKNIVNQFFKPEVKEVFAKPEILRAPEEVKEAWKAAELPGLQLKSTMADGPISKIVEPKTGLINVDQALAIIKKESSGEDKVALIKQALGDDIPKKMDYNEFRKIVQDKLIPLDKKIVNHRSNYGLERLGYNTSNKDLGYSIRYYT
jgi:hypothetical protein